MSISLIDWGIIGFYFIFVLGIGLYFSRRAGQSISDFFVTGRSMPWWLAGTSMVATTFAADTPLAVTELVYTKGIAGNWLWWSMVMSGMLTVFFYSRLWRRVGVLTDIEFSELRYGGKPAAFLRGFRAVYLGLIINTIIMGWVITAMGTIVSVALDIPRWWAIIICLLITVIYASFSGLWGVIVTDFFQFAMAMVGSIMLAFFALKAIGGIDGLRSQLTDLLGSEQAESFLGFAPPVGAAWFPFLLFFVYIAVNWWCSWYPGAEPGGGGYIAQRMFSAKDERHSLLATLWFNIAHYALRPWPWIIVGLCALVFFPGLEDPKEGYVLMMMTYLPVGWLGLMLAALAAAFMSTISTQINWGASYLVNDFYRRFIFPDESESHYVKISRGASVLIMIAGGFVGYAMQSITGGWQLVLTIGAGTGLVYILRWFWWRINAWSEISAMTTALLVSVSLILLERFELIIFDPVLVFAWQMLITVTITTVVWVLVTFLTKPEKQELLSQFVKRARPGGPGWKPVRERLGDEAKTKDNLIWSFLDWIAGCLLIYTILFGIGKIILGYTTLGVLLILLGLIALAFIYWDLERRGWETVTE